MSLLSRGKWGSGTLSYVISPQIKWENGSHTLSWRKAFKDNSSITSASLFGVLAKCWHWRHLGVGVFKS